MTTDHENQLKERIVDMFLILSLPVTVVLLMAFQESILELASWFPIEKGRVTIALMQLGLAYAAICWVTIKTCRLFHKRTSRAVRREYEKDENVR